MGARTQRSVGSVDGPPRAAAAIYATGWPVTLPVAVRHLVARLRIRLIQ